MKVLLIHNFYQSSAPSGEDVVFRNEAALLKKQGIEVITYEKHNDQIAKYSDKLKLPIKVIWSRGTYKELKQLLRRERPQVAHFHNIWYLVSPSAYYACHDAGVPVVQTLHNFRLFCANGLLIRNGKVCEECLGKFPWRGIFHGCYRNSRLYSVPVAFTEAVHQYWGTWNHRVNTYIALNEFGRKKFIEAGWPENKILVKPNFLLNPPKPSFVYSDYIVYLGRLSQEKGVSTLIDAFAKMQSRFNSNLSLKIIGDGPLRKDLEAKVVINGVQKVEFLGRKGYPESMEILSKAKFMIMPSIWYETFSLSSMEAFAHGKPVMASRLGSLAEIVEDGKTGLHFEPGNPEDLAAKMQWMLENEDACVEMGRNARAEFEAKYTAERNYNILMDIYQKTLTKKN